MPNLKLKKKCNLFASIVYTYGLILVWLSF